MMKWFWKLICSWIFHLSPRQIVDRVRRRVYMKCLRCGDEWQYDFQERVPTNWIGFGK